MMAPHTPSGVTDGKTKGEHRAENEHIVSGRVDKMTGMLDDLDTDIDTDVAAVRDGLYELFHKQIDLYVNLNLSKVQEGDDPEEHLHFVLVNHRTEEVIQSSDPHALFRLTHENSDDEDKRSGSKHEVLVAKQLGYDAPDRTDI